MIGFWNVRGLNRPLKQDGVAKYIKQHNLVLFGVLETKLSKTALDKLLRFKFAHWSSFSNFDSDPRHRILLLWDHSKVSCSLLDVGSQWIHVEVKCLVSGDTFLVTTVYGLHSVGTRRPLWKKLVDISTTCTPWLVMGDFNCIFEPGDRGNSTAPPSEYEMVDPQDCCMDAGLSFMNSTGQFYTWTNDNVVSRIDRVLVNSYWLDWNQYSVASFDTPGLISDHTPCRITFDPSQRSNRRTFKFFKMWTLHDSFLPVVSGTWSQGIQGTAMFRLCKKLKQLKHPLKNLNVLHFSHISSRVEAATLELESLQAEHLNDPSVDRSEALGILRKKCQFLSLAEKSFVSQKAKGKFINLSDRGTRFYHSLIKRQHARNHISTILLDDGTYTTSYQQVASEFLRFYMDLLGTKDDNLIPISPLVMENGPSLHPDCFDSLTKQVTSDDIKKVVFELPEDKAPGPDGFSASFFKKAWSVVGKDVTAAVLEFFNNNTLLKQINHAVIALVPKGSHASSVKDYRPISCCNTTYKIIAKILANRLAVVLPSVINEAQAGFVEGRSMVDNILLCQELLRKYNTKRTSPKCMIKVDIKKAFDSMDWDFIRDMLGFLGFPVVFINWIMLCVTSASYSISLNGEMHGYFSGKKGLRQGDPLSPFLFVIGMEYLSRKLDALTSIPDFNFHSQCAEQRIVHLAFADDLMLFCRADSPSVGLVMDCLSDFGEVSGLRSNMAKSHIYLAGVDMATKEELLNITGLERGEMPFRYLGVPLAPARLRVTHYTPLFTQLTDYFGSWKGCTLTYAGRLELIRSVIQGVLGFWLAIFPLPRTVLDKIEGMCRRFLWGGDYESKRRPLVAWKKVCLPKAEGGLGLFDLHARNQALITKTLWNLHKEKESLWVKWISSFYFKGTSIWEYKAKYRDSHLMKYMMEIRDSFVDKAGSTTEASDLLNSWNKENSIHVGKVYDLLRPKANKVWWHSQVWGKHNTPKHSFVLWMACLGKLLTKDRLFFSEHGTTCSLCNSVEESHHHLFFNCNVTKAIWDGIRDWLGIRRMMTTLGSTLRSMKRRFRGTDMLDKSRRIATAATCYFIWHMRNRAVMENTLLPVDRVVKMIKTHTYFVLHSISP